MLDLSILYRCSETNQPRRPRLAVHMQQLCWDLEVTSQSQYRTYSKLYSTALVMWKWGASCALFCAYLHWAQLLFRASLVCCCTLSQCVRIIRASPKELLTQRIRTWRNDFLAACVLLVNAPSSCLPLNNHKARVNFALHGHGICSSYFPATHSPTTVGSNGN